MINFLQWVRAACSRERKQVPTRKHVGKTQQFNDGGALSRPFFFMDLRMTIKMFHTNAAFRGLESVCPARFF